jgi:putative phosphoribosyl transferase
MPAVKNLHVLDDRPQSRFTDRKEAGQRLGQELKNFVEGPCVVLGVLRGGMIVANEVARILKAEIDIVLSRKLRAPGMPELAIGAIAEDGRIFQQEGTIEHLGVTGAYIKQEAAFQMEEIHRRQTYFRRVQSKVSLKGKEVIVTDDGIATGATLQASLWSIRQEHPRRLIAALPVGPSESLKNLSQDADEVLCLLAPASFQGVGQFYLHFDQVSDEEVLGILKDRGAKP